MSAEILGGPQVVVCCRVVLCPVRSVLKQMNACGFSLTASLVLYCQVQEVSCNGQVAVAVKSSKDERYGCHWVVTHDARCMRCYTTDTLQEFKEIMGPHYHKLQVGSVSINLSQLHCHS